jgi:hypothetical protein
MRVSTLQAVLAGSYLTWLFQMDCVCTLVVAEFTSNPSVE